jgi:hypothetical protein
VAKRRRQELCLDRPDSYHRDSTGHPDNIHARQNADNGDGRKFQNRVDLVRRGNDPELIFHFLCVDADQSSADPHHFFLVVAAQTVSARVAGRVDADQNSEVRYVFLVVADQAVSARVADHVDAGQIHVAQVSVTELESAAADSEAVHEAAQATMCVVVEEALQRVLEEVLA